MAVEIRDILRNHVKEKLARDEVVASMAAGITPFVRVPNTDPEHVAAALNGGALGVIAPHVRSAADALRVVTAAKFPPLGGRSATAPAIARVE
jgi:2-keto-3-deoxy-L-rhamnonate aldolase RhmA